MKHLRYFLIPAAVVLTAGFSGCKPESEEETPVKTVFELTQDTVTVAAEGGQASVGYRLEGAQEGASVQPDYTADWLGDFDASVEGTITFNVAANETEAERETEVTVTYADQQDSFVVLQAAAGGGEEPDPDSPFDISVRVEDGSAYVSVVPLDKTITYDLQGVSAEMLNTYPDDMTFVEEFLIPYYRELAGANSMTIQDLMGQILLTGDQTDLELGGLSADTEYYAFCIGLTTSCEITTEFVKEPFKTEPLPAFDAEIDVEVEGPNATVTVTPADQEQTYVIYVFDGHIAEETDGIVAGAQQAIESNISMATQFFGMTREQAVQNLARRGTESELSELTALTDYTATAMTINTNGIITSAPLTYEFTTEDVIMSENEITIEIDTVTGRKVNFTVYATNNDPYVFFTYQYADSWKQMTDEEIIDYIMANNDLYYYTRYGSVTSYEEALRQQTEYVIFAFGYSGGDANTALVKKTFTTTEAELNDCKFSYDFGPYYDGAEAAEKYPDQLAGAVGRIVFPASYVIEGTYYGIWHDMYEGDLSDKTRYPDEDVYMALHDNGNTWMSPTVIYFTDPGKVYTLCGYVESHDGNFSELYRQVVGPFSLDGCSPIDGFNPQFAPSQAKADAAPFFREDPMQAVNTTVKDRPVQPSMSEVVVSETNTTVLKADVSDEVRLLHRISK